MRNSEILIFSVMIFGITVYNLTLSFELPQSMMGWVLSDIILALYVAYLLDTFIRGSTKTKPQ
ncbi:MAG: C4-dicarboxylate ABC transporter [Betaproteobacteria bacterium]|nr:C4-dicarboxylate ABC transporter [Betaproteobacteria bacterium]